MKTKTPIMPGDVKLLAPENMTPSAPGEALTNGRKRRTQNSESGTTTTTCSDTKDSLPMEQRLSALNLEKVDAVAPPQADNMAQLLLQVCHYLQLNFSTFC